MNRWIYILILVVFTISESAYAQDVHFSQFGQTPQLINPGATGVFNGKIRAIMNYRSQWGALGNAFNTYGASFDGAFGKKRRKRNAYLGAGLNFYKDVAGSSNFGNLQVGGSLSGVLPIADNHSISLGIQGAFGQYSANLSSLTWGSQFNGEEFDTKLNSNETFANQSSKYFDLGAGFFYEFKNTKSAFLGTDVSSFNFGVAGYHLNEPKQEFLSNTEDKLPLKIIAQFSGTFDMRGSKLSLVPSMFYAIQGPYQEITPGLLFKIRMGSSTKYTGMFKQGAISFGAHYRIKDAIIPQMYLEFADYMLGISYDYNNSDLSSVTGGNGGFEISIRYINRPKAIQRSSF